MIEKEEAQLVNCAMKILPTYRSNEEQVDAQCINAMGCVNRQVCFAGDLETRCKLRGHDPKRKASAVSK
jgi:hypothetical protein